VNYELPFQAEDYVHRIGRTGRAGNSGKAIDDQEGAVESIGALTTLLNKQATVVLDKTPTRNDPCSCGSGKKYKKCCG
jgi:SWIM/SEC-C metal-binding protein